MQLFESHIENSDRTFIGRNKEWFEFPPSPHRISK